MGKVIYERMSFLAREKRRVKELWTREIEKLIYLVTLGMEEARRKRGKDHRGKGRGELIRSPRLQDWCRAEQEE